MNLFTNSLLNEEVSSVINNHLPDHHTVVSAIIHTEEKDFYPNNIICLEESNDYSKLTSVTMLTVLMGVLEYKKLLVKNRDSFQVTLYRDHNGKKIKNRYKGVLVTIPPDDMDVDITRFYSDNAVDGDIITVEIQCVSFLYSILKQISIGIAVNNTTVEDFIKYTLHNEMGKVKINNIPIKPNIDMVKASNTRKYNSLTVPQDISLLDIPTYIQKKEGVYNGDIGTYIHQKDGKDIMSVYPLYNTDAVNSGIRLAIYVSDVRGISDLSNKTVVLDNDLLKIIVMSDIGKIDNGELSDFDVGGGFKSTNSNQILDRTYTKSGGVLKADSSKMIDSQSNGSKNDMATVKMLPSTDNLYAVRSEVIKNKAKILQLQWNFSRPDYLVPAMGVDLIRIRYGKIIREKAVLLSSFTKYDNKYKNSHTLLNIMIN